MYVRVIATESSDIFGTEKRYRNYAFTSLSRSSIVTLYSGTVSDIVLSAGVPLLNTTLFITQYHNIIAQQNFQHASIVSCYLRYSVMTRCISHYHYDTTYEGIIPVVVNSDVTHH